MRELWQKIKSDSFWAAFVSHIITAVVILAITVVFL